jgi:amidase
VAWTTGEGVVFSERVSTGKRGLLRQFADWLDSGDRTPEDLMALCLERVTARDEQLRAWVEVKPQLTQIKGPLRGIPFGAKDIFETQGLATEYGSPIYAGHKGSADAALVAELRAQGAILLGKTQTTPFAYFDAAPTRNPHNPSHTPGGSSSGSAVAVAAGMVPFALGTQTMGSVLRPASFCGVVGFKPSFGLLPLEGVLPFAPSLDTAGLFTQTVDDMQLLWAAMGYTPSNKRHALAVPSLMPAVEPEMESAFRAMVERLSAKYVLNVVEMPARFSEVTEAAKLVASYEGARTHAERWRQHAERIGRKLAELVESGLEIPDYRYQGALAILEEVKRDMTKLFRQYPFLVTPAAPGAAPKGLEFTGDPIMNIPWTALGTPAISIPMPVSNGLPLGLQLTADRGADSALLALALDIETSLQ